jgi:hypothetical protein
MRTPRPFVVSAPRQTVTRTARQLEANRRNAARSTGPVTPAGRERSSMNAVKHGLTAEKHGILPGEEVAFAAFRDRIVADAKPMGAIEVELVHRLAKGMWRRMRVDVIENELEARERRRNVSDLFERPPDRNPLAELAWRQLLLRYDVDVARQVRLDSHELERRQARRNGDNVSPPIAVDMTLDAGAPPPGVVGGSSAAISTVIEGKATECADENASLASEQGSGNRS